VPGVVGAAVERRLEPQARRQPRDDLGGAAGRGDVARLVDVEVHEAAQLLQPGRRLAQRSGSTSASAIASPSVVPCSSTRARASSASTTGTAVRAATAKPAATPSAPS
jgi:hypothetical protein